MCSFHTVLSPTIISCCLSSSSITSVLYSSGKQHPSDWMINIKCINCFHNCAENNQVKNVAEWGGKFSHCEKDASRKHKTGPVWALFFLCRIGALSLAIVLHHILNFIPFINTGCLKKSTEARRESKRKLSGRFHSARTVRAISGYVFTCTEKAVAQA